MKTCGSSCHAVTDGVRGHAQRQGDTDRTRPLNEPCDRPVNTDKNGRVSDAAERLRRRYPRSRLPRPVLIVVLGLVAAIGLGWLIWAALFHSRPAVDAQVSAFTVISDTAIDVTLTVERREPARPVSCRVIAQAADSRIGGRAAGSGRGRQRASWSTLRVRLVTLRRAAAANGQGLPARVRTPGRRRLITLRDV